jgi:hypothetical protein
MNLILMNAQSTKLLYKFTWNGVCVCARAMNDYQKMHHNEVLSEILKLLETESNVVNWVITGNKSGFFKYNPETKRQSEVCTCQN